VRVRRKMALRVVRKVAKRRTTRRRNQQHRHNSLKHFVLFIIFLRGDIEDISSDKLLRALYTLFLP
jgi:hypothetical protein